MQLHSCSLSSVPVVCECWHRSAVSWSKVQQFDPVEKMVQSSILTLNSLLHLQSIKMSCCSTQTVISPPWIFSAHLLAELWLPLIMILFSLLKDKKCESDILILLLLSKTQRLLICSKINIINEKDNRKELQLSVRLSVIFTINQLELFCL